MYTLLLASRIFYTILIVEDVIKNLGGGVLFVFDGFDELPTELRENFFVSDFIKHPKDLPKATVLVTSRPSASAELQPLLETNGLKLLASQMSQFTNLLLKIPQMLLICLLISPST